jgi:hypothetical protein
MYISKKESKGRQKGEKKKKKRKEKKKKKKRKQNTVCLELGRLIAVGCAAWSVVNGLQRGRGDMRYAAVERRRKKGKKKEKEKKTWQMSAQNGLHWT